MGNHSADSGEGLGDENYEAAEGQGEPEGQIPPTVADPRVFEATLHDELPPLSALGVPVSLAATSRATNPGYHVRPPAGHSASAKKGKRRGAGALVITGSLIVVVGAMAALWALGRNSNASVFTVDQAVSVFVTGADLPMGWEAGQDNTTISPSALASNDYWATEKTSSESCDVIDRSFGLLVAGQPATDPAATSDTIISRGAAYSAQGQSLQQSARVFGSSAAAQDFMTSITTALKTCTSYDTSSSTGQILQTVSPLSISGLQSSAVGFGVTGNGGNDDVVFFNRGNLVIQLMVGAPLSGDTTAITWNDVATTVDARLTSLKG